ncbi:unnamed protein product [Clonostachys rhizophaga]|uniref:Uncharacterized protein n=1 Tax=Clonostachys rhizophaga TaxID=160324 RepID=A0A9N9YEP6_9HYPO|nr:unnamed protein product [Clonostachys rhizophaga]
MSGSTNLLNRVQQDGDLDVRAGQVVRVFPHGRHERDAETCRLGRPAEAHGDGLLPRHALQRNDTLHPGRQVPSELEFGQDWVDGPEEPQGRASRVEADDGEDENPDRPFLPQRPYDLADDERQQDAQPHLLCHVCVHVAEGAGVGRPPRVEDGAGGHEPVDEDGGEEGADDVAKHHADDGGRIVATRGPGHDDVGGDRRGDARYHQHADDDGQRRRAAFQRTASNTYMEDRYIHDSSLVSTNFVPS